VGRWTGSLGELGVGELGVHELGEGKLWGRWTLLVKSFDVWKK